MPTPRTLHFLALLAACGTPEPTADDSLDQVAVSEELGRSFVGQAQGAEYRTTPERRPSERRARIQRDSDGDGVASLATGGTDCDDHDATVHPGAADSWYDGIDADCAGDDDYDQDGDGYTSEAFGGTDPDDQDPDIYPDVAEHWPPELSPGRIGDAYATELAVASLRRGW